MIYCSLTELLAIFCSLKILLCCKYANYWLQNLYILKKTKHDCYDGSESISVSHSTGNFLFMLKNDCHKKSCYVFTIKKNIFHNDYGKQKNTFQMLSNKMFIVFFKVSDSCG